MKRAARKARVAEREERAAASRRDREEIFEVGDEGMSLEALAEAIQVDPSDIMRSLFMKGILLSLNQVGWIGGGAVAAAAVNAAAAFAAVGAAAFAAVAAAVNAAAFDAVGAAAFTSPAQRLFPPATNTHTHTHIHPRGLIRYWTRTP
jgi:hypothetical protein